MRAITIITVLMIMGFLLTSAISGYNLSYNAELLLNGGLTGKMLQTTQEHFLMSHISLWHSVVFAVLSLVSLIVYLLMFLSKK